MRYPVISPAPPLVRLLLPTKEKPMSRTFWKIAVALIGFGMFVVYATQAVANCF